MPDSPPASAPDQVRRKPWGWITTLAGLVGLVAAPVGFLSIQSTQFNVVTYRAESYATARYWPAFVFGMCLLCVPMAAAVVSTLRRTRAVSWGNVFAPLVLAIPLALSQVLGQELQFIAVYVFTIGLAWTSGRAAAILSSYGRRPPPDWLCLLVIGAAIAGLTAVHVRIQQSFFDHFMLGHADMGHYLEEMKNALAGRGLRSDSFPNTRLGWHFTPLLYLLVPGYALCPSPTYLMVMGPLFLHVTALPIYWLARSDRHHTTSALLLGLAWLLMPSVSRLVYGNTYGFQWLYFSIPVIALLVAAFHRARWPLYWTACAVILLTQETNAALVFGFGLYALCFTKHRVAGVVTAVTAFAYLLLCTQLIIPYFASAQRYERLDLFGGLGDSMIAIAASLLTQPGSVFQRLTRPESIHLIALLMAVTGLVPLLRWRLLLAALPPLVLVMLLQNPDWLSIKFWHQATILPVLLAAAALAIRTDFSEGDDCANRILGAAPRPPQVRAVGIAICVFFAAAWGHYFFGYSPISKSYEVYAGETQFHEPDPRLAFVERLRREIPRARTVLATERMAAHFTDYSRLFTGGRPFAADFVIIDRSDTWDTSDLPRRAGDFASDPAYKAYAESGPVIVFQRVSESASLPP